MRRERSPSSRRRGRNDVLIGGAGNDTLLGEAANVVSGRPRHDELDGGPGKTPSGSDCLGKWNVGGLARPVVSSTIRACDLSRDTGSAVLTSNGSRTIDQALFDSHASGNGGTTVSRWELDAASDAGFISML